MNRMLRGATVLATIAGLVQPAFAASMQPVTTQPDPSPDVAPIHDRQMVILERSNWSAWLQETGNEKELLNALPPGSLSVEQIRP